MDVAMIQVNTEKIGNITIVELAGVLDAITAPQVQEAILPLADHGSRIMLDMSHVTYMSSAGLRMLLLLYRRINEDDHTGQIVLSGLNEDLEDVMAITGFLDFFTTVEDREAGMRILV
jgi:anti-sigma B factor antagonist